ncbi:MAG: hypothetical protein HZC05_01915 [Candidatus Magasanikbacteria bacterium]|nr:hypothetical protein [Candidatus Magasanikbacteria bacterium]
MSEQSESIRIIKDSVTLLELKKIAEERFGDMAKAVVDIERAVMAIGGEMHADEEQILLEAGSKQEDLWGVNLYPDASGENFVEFDSMINIRPRQGNRSRGVENEKIRTAVLEIIKKLVK